MSKVITDIQKAYGQGSICVLGESDVLKLPRIHTGSLVLDEAMGGGLPEERITVVVGNESSGKSTLSLHLMAESQKKYPDKYVALIDSEFSFDPNYARALGVELNRLFLSQPDTGQEAWGIIEKLVGSNEVSLIVLDSIATLQSLQDFGNEIGDASIGTNARLNGQALRKITPMLKKHHVTLVLINQWRMSIGGFGHGDPRVMPGGNAIKYGASVIIDMARKATNKERGEAVSNRTIVKVKKNKTANPFTQCEFDIVYGEGIDSIGEIIDIAVEQKLMQKSGAWFKLLDAETGEIIQSEQGKPNMRQYLKDNLDVYNTLRTNTLNKLGLT